MSVEFLLLFIIMASSAVSAPSSSKMTMLAPPSRRPTTLLTPAARAKQVETSVADIHRQAAIAKKLSELHEERFRVYTADSRAPVCEDENDDTLHIDFEPMEEETHDDSSSSDYPQDTNDDVGSPHEDSEGDLN